jgi:hypothetical protein
MKKLLSLLFCLVLMGTVIGQEKYLVPEIPVEKKLNMTYSQTWAIIAVGVDFAKSQGVTPYDYGKYIGKVFAPSWNKEAGFEGLVKGGIYSWEGFKTDEDGPMVVKEKDDGSVLLIIPIQAWKKYFSEENPIATFEEVIDCLRAVIEEIADYMSSEVKLEITEESIICELSKK